jgi:5-methylcytosine-specific restriction endonuclease McrA
MTRQRHEGIALSPLPMSDEESVAQVRAAGVTDLGSELLQHVRHGDPARRTGSSTRSVAGSFASPRMGRGIPFEIHGQRDIKVLRAAAIVRLATTLEAAAELMGEALEEATEAVRVHRSGGGSVMAPDRRAADDRAAARRLPPSATSMARGPVRRRLPEHPCLDCGRPAGHARNGQRYRRCHRCAALRTLRLRRRARLADYHRHRDRRRAARRAWEQANPDVCRARFRRTYWRDPERRRQATRQWQRQNLRLVRERLRRRRSRIGSVPTLPYQDGDIFERDAWTCGLCRGPVDPALSRNHAMGATIDHVIPVVLGGHDVPENVQLAHRSCNARKGGRATR